MDSLTQLLLILGCFTMETLTEVSYIGSFDHNGADNMTISDEKRLLRHLLEKYSRAGRGGRPVYNMSLPTLVEFGLGLIQMELDEKKKIFTTSMWSRLRWHDAYLAWNPGEYGGVQSVRLESNQIWKPDIMLYNTADPDGAARNALMVVAFDGYVQWVPHQIFKSSCSIDVRDFPFDQQTCHMWFGSWTHSRNDIDLQLAFPAGIDLSPFQSDFKDSCEWEIIDPIAEKKLLPENDTQPIAVLAFTLHLQRKLVFSSYILTLPCIFLASLTLVVFWLPPDRPDRTGLAMSLFASFLVLLLILVEAAPPTASSVPIIGIYYSFNMVIIMLSIFLSTMVVNIHRAGECRRRVPVWLRFVSLTILGRLFCVTSPPKAIGRVKYKMSDIHDDEDMQRFVQLKQEPHMSNGTFGYNKNVDASVSSNSQNSRTDVVTWDHLECQLTNIKKAMDVLMQITIRKQQQSNELKEIVYEWRQVARALDRLFFIVYLVAIILSLLFLFPRYPWNEILAKEARANVTAT